MARRHKRRYGDPVKLSVSARQALDHVGARWAVVFRFGEKVDIHDLYRTKATAYDDALRLNREARLNGTGWEYELARIDLGE